MRFLTLLGGVSALLSACVVQSETPVIHLSYDIGEDTGPMDRLVSQIDALPTSDPRGVRAVTRRFESETSLRTSLSLQVPPDLATVVYGSQLSAETFPLLSNLTLSYLSAGLGDQVPPAVARASVHTDGASGVSYPVLMPYAASVSVFCYRKSVFARQGLAVPETWGDLMGTLRKLRDAGGGKAPMSTTHVSRGGSAMWLFDMVFARLYGREAHERLLNGEIDLVSDPRVKEAVLLSAVPFLEGLIASSGSLFPDLLAFAMGKQSVFWGPNFLISILSAAMPQLSGDIGIFPFPTVTTGLPRAEILPFRAFVVPAAAPLASFGIQVIDKLISPPTGYDVFFEGDAEPQTVPIIKSHTERIPSRFALTKELAGVVTAADEVLVSLYDGKVPYREAIFQVLNAAHVPPGTNATAFQALFFPASSGGGGPPSSGGGGPPSTGGGGGGGPPPGTPGGPPAMSRSRSAAKAGSSPKSTVDDWFLTTPEAAMEEASMQAAHVVPPGLVDALTRALRGVVVTPNVEGEKAKGSHDAVVWSRSRKSKESKADSNNAQESRKITTTATATTTTTTTRAAVAAGAAPGAVGTDAVIAAVDSALAMAEATRVAEFLGKVPDPVATPAAGAYEVPLEVKVTTGLDGDDKVKIFFTLDGSVPTELSPEYSGALTLSQPGDTTLRLLATREGLASSKRVTVVYALSGGDGDGMTIEEIMTLVVAPVAAALLLIGIAVYLFVRRRLAAARDSQWEIDPADMTINRDKVLGVGSFGIVYEGTFRGTAVAVKELFMSRKAWEAARGASSSFIMGSSLGSIGGTSTVSRTTAPTGKKDARVAPSSTLQKQYGTTDGAEPADAAAAPSTTLLPSRMGSAWGTTTNDTGSGVHLNLNTRDNVSRVRSIFASEIATISSLRHPNCLFLYGAYLTKTTAAMAVERMAYSVYDLLHTRTARASAKRRLEMAGDAASGLVYLHAHNPPIMHRDVKSLNLLVSDRGEVKVSDFGLSEIQGKNGRSIGSAPWTAPEVWADPASYSLASDVYSFGVTLYEFATSRDPWSGVPGVATAADISKRVAVGDRPPLSRDDLASDVIPDGLIDLINDCWAHEPSQRPTMAQVHARLAELTATVPDEDEGGADVGLLSLMVPAAQAREMMAMSRRGEPVPPIELESTTILFADIVGFTEISSRLSPTKVTALLTRCFDIFEAIIAEQRLVKVDTIGDCIIIGGGLRSEERASGADAGDHAPRVLKAALEMIDRTKGVTIDPEDPDATAVRWRIGVATGPITATVVGREVLKTQLVGDACNTASRMESTGVAGRVQVTDGVRSACIHDASLSFKKRGAMQIKGKGEMLTWWVE